MDNPKSKSPNLIEIYVDLYKDGVISESEFRQNVGILSDFLIMKDHLILYETYKMVLEIPGIMVDFGCRWGKNIITMVHLRSLLEPHNLSRKFIAFDTFAGFTGVSKEDKNELNLNSTEHKKGAYSVRVKSYEKYLYALLESYSKMLGYSPDRNFKLIKGDVVDTAPKFFSQNKFPIALAVFDFDLYAPTKACLEQIWPLMDKGSIIIFDQYCYEKWPGETIAVKEFFADKGKQEIKRLPISQTSAYLQVG